jgi:hypothetical protein
MMRLAERRMRKSGDLKTDDRILEWKQGRIRRWRIDGSDQAIPQFHGLERISIFNGMMAINYSACCLFLIGAGGRSWMTDLAFIIRIWHAAPQSVCLIYSRFNPESDENQTAARRPQPRTVMGRWLNRLLKL